MSKKVKSSEPAKKCKSKPKHVKKKIKVEKCESIVVEPKLSKKKLKIEENEANILSPASSVSTVKELSKLTGLSEFMLDVTMELLLDKVNPLTLIDIVCPNDQIRSLNHSEIEAHRVEYTLKKQQKISDEGGKKTKVHTNDEIRKFIVEKAEKTLQNTGVRIAGSTQHEKMDPTQKDKTLVSDFLGYGQTSRGYFVYCYFIGPSIGSENRAVELRNPRNWLVVHKSHLGYFHKRLRFYNSFLKHTKYDQVSFREPGTLGVTPSYDPRFIVDRWLRKDGVAHRTLLRNHKSLFEKEKDFLVKHYEQEEATATTSIHYYDETKPEVLMLDLTKENEEEGERFNVALDKQRQASVGYRYIDKELCHVTIEEFPPLSRTPLPREIDLDFQEFLSIVKRVYMNERNPMPPDHYRVDPFIMVKSAMMALNMEMQIRRVPSILGDEKLQILEADNIKPILDYFGNDSSCAEEIKKACFNCLLSLMSTEIMTREEPAHISEAFEKRNGTASFTPLTI